MVVFAKNAHYALGDLAATEFDVIQLDWTIDPLHVSRSARSLAASSFEKKKFTYHLLLWLLLVLSFVA